MSIDTRPPILSYVASSDNSVLTDGSLRYNIFFDESLCTLGTVIMFEYMIKDYDVVVPTNVNTSYGFVSTDYTISTGIQNQYILVVPAGNQTLTGVSHEHIQFRVYVGQKSSNDVVVTEWSNHLDVHYPPVTPDLTRATAFYEPTNDNNDLYVFFDPSNNLFDYDNIQFIVCYYFQDASDNTVWGVSDPKYASDVTIGNKTYKIVDVRNIGHIHTVHNLVYVSMHAVYNWTEMLNKFYSVSYVSSQIIAIASSSDNTPNITSVTYNVYDTPSVQSMLVEWVAPGNSGIDLYEVVGYDLYYQLTVNDVAGSFIKYNTTIIPSTTLSYTVNVDSSPLVMNCGNSIVYKVVALIVNQGEEPSADSISTNCFKYSGAVRNLSITDTSVSSGFSNLTVNFTAPSNTGCGIPTNYVVLINGETYIPSSGSLAYDAGNAKQIVYSGLEDLVLNGTVEVYLQTTDTNPDFEQMNGASSTQPYIINDMVLSPIVYNVYNSGNNTQTMSLDWSAPSLQSGWTLSSYQLLMSADGVNFEPITPAPQTNVYTYSVPSNYLITATNLQFKVNATVANGTTQYVMTSNIESKNTFSYASVPLEDVVWWSASNSSLTLMDMYLTFKNPASNGTNNGLQHFMVNVYDNNSSPTLISSQQVEYIPGSTLYQVYFDDVAYSASGNVLISAYVTDTNTVDIITYPDYAAQAGYITSDIPIFVYENATSTSFSGNIISQGPLDLLGMVIYRDGADATKLLAKKQINTLFGNTGFTISNTIDESTNVYEYTFTLTYDEFFPIGVVVPSFSLAVANNVGVGVSLVNNIPV